MSGREIIPILFGLTLFLSVDVHAKGGRKLTRDEILKTLDVKWQSSVVQSQADACKVTATHEFNLALKAKTVSGDPKAWFDQKFKVCMEDSNFTLVAVGKYIRFKDPTFENCKIILNKTGLETYIQVNQPRAIGEALENKMRADATAFARENYKSFRALSGQGAVEGVKQGAWSAISWIPELFDAIGYGGAAAFQYVLGDSTERIAGQLDSIGIKLPELGDVKAMAKKIKEDPNGPKAAAMATEQVVWGLAEIYNCLSPKAQRPMATLVQASIMPSTLAFLALMAVNVEGKALQIGARGVQAIKGASVVGKGATGESSVARVTDVRYGFLSVKPIIEDTVQYFRQGHKFDDVPRPPGTPPMTVPRAFAGDRTRYQRGSSAADDAADDAGAGSGVGKVIGVGGAAVVGTGAAATAIAPVLNPGFNPVNGSGAPGSPQRRYGVLTGAESDEDLIAMLNDPRMANWHWEIENEIARRKQAGTWRQPAYAPSRRVSVSERFADKVSPSQLEMVDQLLLQNCCSLTPRQRDMLSRSGSICVQVSDESLCSLDGKKVFLNYRSFNDGSWREQVLHEICHAVEQKPYLGTRNEFERLCMEFHANWMAFCHNDQRAYAMTRRNHPQLFNTAYFGDEGPYYLKTMCKRMFPGDFR